VNSPNGPILDDNQWKDLVTDGGSLNKAWKAHLDDLAPYFQELKDKGVQPLFRPLHEMNQHSFWWGKSGQNGTAQLFRITHDYLVKTKGFTNIAFVWDMQDIGAPGGAPGGSDFADYYPGDAYCDVAALDVYGDGYSNTSYYSAMLALAKGKPIAIGETFDLPSAGVQQSMPQMSFFMMWAYGVYKISNQDLTATYTDPRTIRLSDMPGWLDAIARARGRRGSLGPLEARSFTPDSVA
jgi:mannan endo-1,4-beta-mannosidase